MDNSIQPINDPENFPTSDNQEIPYVPTQTSIVNPVSVEETNIIDQQPEGKEDDRPASATSTTSTKIMETNTDELLDQTLQQNE